MVNYTYEKKVDSKYTYKTIESDTQIFIFEVLLKDINNQVHSIRRIKKANQGQLISKEDSILFETTKQFKITVIDINQPNNPITLKGNIKHDNTYTTFLNKEIYLELSQQNKFLECVYQIGK